MTSREREIILAQRQYWKDRALSAERELRRLRGQPGDPIYDRATGRVYDRQTGKEWTQDAFGRWKESVANGEKEN